MDSRPLNTYESAVKGRSSEELLANIGGTFSQTVTADYVMVAAQVRVTQEQIKAQENATRHVVECTNSLVASQGKATNSLVESIGKLTASIDSAAVDSGKLSSRIAVFTLLLVLVGAGQILVTAWPYLSWWWHH